MQRSKGFPNNVSRRMPPQTYQENANGQTPPAFQKFRSPATRITKIKAKRHENSVTPMIALCHPERPPRCRESYLRQASQTMIPQGRRGSIRWLVYRLGKTHEKISPCTSRNCPRAQLLAFRNCIIRRGWTEVSRPYQVLEEPRRKQIFIEQFAFCRHIGHVARKG